MSERTIDISLKIISWWPALLLVGFASTYLPTVSVVGYRWTVELALAAFLLVACFTSVAGRSLDNENIISKSEFLWTVVPIVLFTIWGGLSVLWAESWRNALHHTLLWVCYALFYILIRFAIRDPKVTNFCFNVLGVIIFAVGLAGVLEFIGSPKPITASFTTKYYPYAEVIVSFLPILAVRAFEEGSSRSLFWILNLAIGWFLVIATTSRIMFVAGVLTLLFLFLFLLLKKRSSVYTWKLPAVALIIVSFAFIPQLSKLRGDNITLVDRLSGQEQYSVESAKSRLLLWDLALEGLRKSPIFGIGGDNYYSAYKSLRENLSQRDPENPNIEINEDLIPERAHSEYLQILCELGLVGGLLFGWLLLGIGYMFIRALRTDASMLTLGALSGIVSFLIASAASSYSFRFPLNGSCFFYLLAILSNGIFSKVGDASAVNISSALQRWVIRSGILVSLLMIVFSVVRALSFNHLANFQNTNDKEFAEYEIKRAIAIDPDEPMFHFYYGEHLYLAGHNDKAVVELRHAIDNGLATSPAYFDLVGAQMKQGKNDEALRSFQEAVRVYPRSVFLRTGFSSFLKRIGYANRAESEFQIAAAVNERQARSWQLAHDKGLERLAQLSRVDDQYASTFELRPASAALSLDKFQSYTHKYGQ